MQRIVEVRRFDHVVLLVAAQDRVAGRKPAGDLDIARMRQRIERMRQVLRDRMPGCASNATRRPLSGARNAGSAMVDRCQIS